MNNIEAVRKRRRDRELNQLLQNVGWTMGPVTLVPEQPTLRDEFAGRAMQTLLSTEYTSEQVSSEGWPRELAHEAYWIADAMLKARVKPAA